MPTIEELERAVTEKSDALAAAKKELEEARVAACGISVGDIVIGTGRVKGQVRVTHIDTSSSPPWLKGVSQRADGSFGKQIRHLFNDWTRA